MTQPVITLTTDFGSDSAYVGMMKGVILSIAPQAHVVDLEHNIRTQNVLQAAFVLAGAARYFPAGTVHVAVVDPGVGSDRKLVALKTSAGVFLAPDNGLLSIIYDHATESSVHSVTARKYFLPEVSATFHGRDILAPVAAHVAQGVKVEDLGPALEGMTRLAYLTGRDDLGAIRGKVVHIDRFGNLITNISHDDVGELKPTKEHFPADLSVGIKGSAYQKFVNTYSDAGPGEIVSYIGSTGYLEIAVVFENAADRLGVRLGQEVLCW